MNRYDFYQILSNEKKKVLYNLICTVLNKNKKIVILSNQIYFLDNFLWTFNNKSWIPHGIEGDNFSQYNPIWITSKEENPIDAEIIISINGKWINKPTLFKRGLFLFDSDDQYKISFFKKKMKLLLNLNKNVFYWTQKNYKTWNQSFF